MSRLGLNRRDGIALATLIIIIVGVALVIYLITLGPLGLRGFTELYFENPDLLPKAARIGEEISVTFTVVSHERTTLRYTYTAFFGRKLVDNGTLTLAPSERAVVSFTFIPNSTTLALYDNYTDKCEVKLPYSFQEVRNLQLGSKGSVYLAPLQGNICLMYHNHTLKAITVPSPFNPSSYFLLPLKNESRVNYTYVTVRRVGNLTQLGRVEGNFSNVGYDKVITKYEVIREDDNQVTVKYSCHVLKYRYRFEKVSVKLTSKKARYEIHFWLIVTK